MIDWFPFGAAPFVGLAAWSIAGVFAAHAFGCFVRGAFGFGSNVPIVIATTFLLGPHHAILLALLVRRIYVLVRDYRNHVPGSRLAVRTVAIFGTLAMVPLLVVYLFALSFLSRGIESWFTKGLGRELRGATELAAAALQLEQQQQGERTAELAMNLSGYSTNSLALLFLGFATSNTPFLGGTLVPFPIATSISLNTGPNGGFTLPFVWPAGVPSGMTIATQCWIQDAAAFAGAAASNGLAMSTP